MKPERQEKSRAVLEQRKRGNIRQVTFGWHEIVDQGELAQMADRFFGTFFPNDERRVPAPYITWDVSHASSQANTPEQGACIDDLHRKCLPAMKSVGSISEWLVLENINHPWYRLNLEETPVHIERWPVDLLPWADPCYLVASNFSCGFIADLDRTISVFGQPLIDAMQLNLPSIFTHVIEFG